MKRGNAPLWLLVAVFFGPLLLAVGLYFGPWGTDFLPRLKVEGGELLEPPLSLPPLELAEDPGGEGRYGWLLLYATMTPCGQDCAGDWERLRQVHDALGRDRPRVRRVLLHGGSERPALVDPELAWGRIDAAGNRAAVDVLGAERVRGGGIFVVDPLGNVVLAYRRDVSREDLLDDLERLLDVSRIG